MNLQVPAGNAATHYGIWSGGTFLRGEVLNPSIVVNGTGAMGVDFTPRTKYS